jgi:hypothetical protein
MFQLCPKIFFIHYLHSIVSRFSNRGSENVPFSKIKYKIIKSHSIILVLLLALLFLVFSYIIYYKDTA